MIELMIAVACIGILASIALPSYQSYVYKAKAAEVLLEIGKIRTALATLQAERGATIGRPVMVFFNDRGGRPDDAALQSCVISATANSCDKTTLQSVSGLNLAELKFEHLGVTLSVGAGDSYMTKQPGQFKVTVSEDQTVTRGLPAARASARQIVMAVYQEMKASAYATKVGTDSASLYFNLTGMKP